MCRESGAQGGARWLDWFPLNLDKTHNPHTAAPSRDSSRCAAQVRSGRLQERPSSAQWISVLNEMIILTSFSRWQTEEVSGLCE